MKILESSENYLETILLLSKRLPVVRSVDIAEELSFARPSVSIAMKRLRENGYIEVDGSGFITLTEEGKKIADSVYDRHVLLTEFFKSLGVDPETASEDACRIEHVISTESFHAMCNDLKKRKNQDGKQ